MFAICGSKEFICEKVIWKFVLQHLKLRQPLYYRWAVVTQKGTLKWQMLQFSDPQCRKKIWICSNKSHTTWMKTYESSSVSCDIFSPSSLCTSQCAAPPPPPQTDPGDSDRNIICLSESPHWVRKALSDHVGGVTYFMLYSECLRVTGRGRKCLSDSPGWVVRSPPGCPWRGEGGLHNDWCITITC